MVVMKKHIKSLLARKKNFRPILIIIIFGIFLVFLLRMETGIINNAKTEISIFIPAVIVPGIKLEKVENLDSADDQGYIQKGFAFFNVDGQEAASNINDNGELFTQTTPIILTLFVCNRGSAKKCEEYLGNGILEQNKGISKNKISIHGKDVSFVSFEGANQQLDPNFEKTKLNSTSYLWCEGNHCFQAFSYKEFATVTEALINSVIENYTNK